MNRMPVTGPPRIPALAGQGPRPLVSVMIPTFNGRETLRAALESVMAQDMGPDLMQIEVVDNGTDGNCARAVAESVGQGRIVYHRNTHNLGPIGNFNACITRARGEWVHILHDDDLVRPGFHARLVRAARTEPRANAFACRVIYMDGTGTWLGLAEPEQPLPGLLGARGVSRQLIEQRFQFAGMVVRRSAYERLGGFRPELPHCTDWDMWNRLVLAGPVFYDPEPLACFRLHAAADTSRMVRTGENVVDERRCIDIACSYVPAQHGDCINRRALRAAAIRAARAARILWKAGQRAPALRQVREALRCSAAPGPMLRVAYTIVLMVIWREEDPAHMMNLAQNLHFAPPFADGTPVDNPESLSRPTT